MLIRAEEATNTSTKLYTVRAQRSNTRLILEHAPSSSLSDAYSSERNDLEHLLQELRVMSTSLGMHIVTPLMIQESHDAL